MIVEVAPSCGPRTESGEARLMAIDLSRWSTLTGHAQPVIYCDEELYELGWNGSRPVQWLFRATTR